MHHFENFLVETYVYTRIKLSLIFIGCVRDSDADWIHPNEFEKGNISTIVSG